MTVKLTTSQSSGQTFHAWLESWESALSNGYGFDAGVTTGRAGFGVGDLGLMPAQHPEWAAKISSYGNDITYVIRAWATPMAVYVERGAGFWVFPDVRYISPENGKKSTRTTRIQNHLRHVLISHMNERVFETLAELDN